MAKRARVHRSGGSSVVVVPSPAPMTRRRSRGGGVRRRRSSGRRRGRIGGGSSSGLNQMVGHAVGGFAVGFLEKSFPNLPSLPIIGKKGAIAIGAYMLRSQSPLLLDVAKAAAAISGYQLGSTGSVTGDVVGWSDDVDGVAAQM